MSVFLCCIRGRVLYSCIRGRVLYCCTRAGTQQQRLSNNFTRPDITLIGPMLPWSTRQNKREKLEFAAWKGRTAARASGARGGPRGTNSGGCRVRSAAVY